MFRSFCPQIFDSVFCSGMTCSFIKLATPFCWGSMPHPLSSVSNEVSFWFQSQQEYKKVLSLSCVCSCYNGQYLIDIAFQTGEVESSVLPTSYLLEQIFLYANCASCKQFCCIYMCILLINDFKTDTNYRNQIAFCFISSNGYSSIAPPVTVLSKGDRKPK